MKTMINIAICDDNVMDLVEEEKLIKNVLQHKNLSYSVDLFQSANELIKLSKNYAIIFLDVEMEELSGIDTATKIHEKNSECLIFFVTNHEGYMDDALNKHAFRFWTKPLNDKRRLIYGIESAIKEIEGRNVFLNVVVNKKIIPVLMKDIIIVFTENRITNIITVDGKLQSKENLKQIKQRLNKNYFGESHASYFANFNYVSDYDNTQVICKYANDEYIIPMSRRKYPDFKKEFIVWSGGQI